MLGCGAVRCGCAGRLLAHVNLLLVVYGGAALATAARLKWDPSTYVALRELLPAEYAALAAGATTAGLSLLLLPHVAAAGLLAASAATRRVLLYFYAGALSALALGELALGAWLAARLQRWQQSSVALQLREALELRDHVRALLQYFGRWHPAPSRIDALIQEAEADAPCLLGALLAGAALLALLQALAVALALCAARPAGAGAGEPPARRVRSGRGAGPRHTPAVTRCITFVVNIYYREKRRSAELPASLL